MMRARAQNMLRLATLADAEGGSERARAVMRDKRERLRFFDGDTVLTLAAALASPHRVTRAEAGDDAYRLRHTSAPAPSAASASVSAAATFILESGYSGNAT